MDYSTNDRVLKIPLTSLSYEKSQMLKHCNSTPKFYLKLSDITDRLNGITWYNCEVGIEMGTDVVVKNIKFRYSDMEALWKEIKKKWYKSVIGVEFPEKTWFWNNNEAVIAHRVECFKNIMKILMMIPNIWSENKFEAIFA